MIRTELDDLLVLDALNEIMARIEHPRPLMMEIGETLAESTKVRFATSTAPDGSAWAPNSEVTRTIYGGLFAGEPPAKKPLVGETRRLANDIAWQLDGDKAVEIGSPMPYANMQQFGGTKSQWPHLWGDIPARPYLGVSDEDRATILELVDAYLAP